MLNLKTDKNTVTGKFARQAENALSDERFNPVDFAFDVTTWQHNAQARLFHIVSAYITVIASYASKGYVPRQLVDVGRICQDLKKTLDEHLSTEIKTKWVQEEMDFTQI